MRPKPLIDNLDRPDLQEYYRKMLQGFYGVLKAMDGYIKFGFLTGVTKIGKLSVFSSLNNLRDISMLPQYADICGISGNTLLHLTSSGNIGSRPEPRHSL